MLLAFVCFRAASDETELPTPNHPAVHDPQRTSARSMEGLICLDGEPKQFFGA